jgi:hypothetical protein
MSLNLSASPGDPIFNSSRRRPSLVNQLGQNIFGHNDSLNGIALGSTNRGKKLTSKLSLNTPSLLESEGGVKRRQESIKKALMLEHEKNSSGYAVKLLARTTKLYIIWKRGFFATLVAMLTATDHFFVGLTIMTVEFLQYLAFCFMDIHWGTYGNVFGYIISFFQVSLNLIFIV